MSWSDCGLCCAGLFNPQSFLTAVMQTTARRNGWPLDKTVIVTEVTKRTPEQVGRGCQPCMALRAAVPLHCAPHCEQHIMLLAGPFLHPAHCLLSGPV